MGIDQLIVVGVLAGAFVALVILLGFRRRVQHRLFRATGLEEWRKAAAGLSWRDRWKVTRANTTGRTVETRLARHAIQRAEAMIAVSERVVQWGPARWLVTVGGALAVATSVTQAVWSFSNGHGWRDWPMIGLQMVGATLLAVLALFWTPLHRRDQRRLRRSATLNAELLGGSFQQSEVGDE